MIKMIWGAIKGAVGGAIGGTNVGGIFDTLSELYLKRADAKTELELAEIDAEIEALRMRAEQTQNLQGYWMTAWIRPAFALVVFLYVAKAMLWDAALHLGTTDPIGGVVEYAAVAVVGFYFLTRPFEKALGRFRG